jgi:hypothetical protein
MNDDKKQQYLLDTNILIKRPGLLARNDATKRLLIPIAAIEQLSNRGHGTVSGPLERVLSAASKSGVELIDYPKIDDRVTRTLLGQLTSREFRLDKFDSAILETLLDLQSDATRKVSLVTEDRALRMAANQLGLGALSLDELQKSLDEVEEDTVSPVNFEVKKQVDNYEKSERWSIRSTIAISAFGTLIAYLVYSNNQQIFAVLATTPRVFIAVVAVLFSMILYWFRQRYRAAYGIVETVIGAWITSKAVPLSSVSDIIGSGLQVIGGLYVVVRGLDNSSAGIDERSYEPSWWRRLYK